MNCLIDSAINVLAKQGQNPEAIRRYIKMKYRINMDMASLKKRLNKVRTSTSPLNTAPLHPYS